MPDFDSVLSDWSLGFITGKSETHKGHIFNDIVNKYVELLITYRIFNFKINMKLLIHSMLLREEISLCSQLMKHLILLPRIGFRFTYEQRSGISGGDICLVAFVSSIGTIVKLPYCIRSVYIETLVKLSPSG